MLESAQPAEIQADSPGHTLHDSHNYKTPQRVLTAYCNNVIQASQRYPVMNPQKDNLKCLQSQKERLQKPVC
jgi:hypothetical protein